MEDEEIWVWGYGMELMEVGYGLGNARKEGGSGEVLPWIEGIGRWGGGRGGWSGEWFLDVVRWNGRDCRLN